MAGAIDAVTRRDNETYQEFVERAAAAPYGAPVKLADVLDHLDLRFSAGLTAELRARYEDAIPVLAGALAKGDAFSGLRLREASDLLFGALEDRLAVSRKTIARASWAIR